jgi:SNF2 family DNA or RNA helicase
VTTERAPIALVEGSARERVRLYSETSAGFLVTNYEQLIRDIEHVQGFAPELVVLDEAQRIKNWATKSNAYVMSLHPEWRLVLTGTPLENRLEELATLLDWIDDAALAPKWRLAPWHTSFSADGGSRVGARHLDTLRQRVSHCVVRRVRHEVLSQLPPRTDVRVPVEMTEQQREQHDALIVPIAQLVQAAQRRPLRQPEFLRLMQLLTQQRIISNGLAQHHFDEVWPTYRRAPADEALLAGCNSPKLVEFRRVLSDLVLQQGRKVVVFSQWRKMLHLAEWAVQGLLEAQGYRSVFFTGEESQNARTRNIELFHEDEHVRVMFLSDAGGVGLNLQHAASACINLELPWNPAVLEQRIGRIYRLGQDQPIAVISLVTEYGIESRIAAVVSNKRALFTGLFDGTSDSVRFDAPAGFLEDVQRLVEPVVVPMPADDANEGAEGGADDAETGADALGSADAPEGATIQRATTEPTAAAHTEGALQTSLPSAPRVASLLERLAITRTEAGGLRIEAPPDVADELSQLLQELARMLGTAPRA